jgi:hypothetical protein
MMAMPRSALIFVVVLLCLVTAAYAQDQQDQPEATPPAPAPRKKASDLLPRNFVITDKDVRQYFPPLIRQLEVGGDMNASGKPAASRRVVYGSSDGAQKLAISVDDYYVGSQAALAYEVAARQSQVPEFEPIAISNIGQQVFGGALKQNGETQVTITALDDRMLVTLQLTGYESTTENIAKLADLARLQVSEAHSRINTRRR